jgi:hypothetical protein
MVPPKKKEWCWRPSDFVRCTRIADSLSTATAFSVRTIPDSGRGSRGKWRDRDRVWLVQERGTMDAGRHDYSPISPPPSKSSVSVQNHMNFVQFRYAQQEDPPTLAPHSIAFRPWAKSASGFLGASGAGPLATRHQTSPAQPDRSSSPEVPRDPFRASGTETLR